MHGRLAGLAVALTVLLALPAAAGAATKTVQVGPFGTQQAKFQAAAGDGNAFYRHTITIHKGDKVRWINNGFHSITFVPDGEPTPGLLVPDPNNLVSGMNDEAGNPFWFNGQPAIGFNPVAGAPQGGRTFKPDVLENSGLPLGPTSTPYKLKFKRRGTFGYVCLVHPGMAGKVKVVKRGRKIPSARKDRRAARRELKTTLQRVQRLTTGLGTEDLEKTIQAGNDRRSGATIYKFFPQNPTYHVGDEVTLRMAPRSTEVHTLTLGPTNGKDAYNDVIASSFEGAAIDQRGIYPSDDPKLGVPSYTGTSFHGNGFYNSGVLDADAASPPPGSTKITFTAAGTFDLICLIHPFMTNKVTVTP
jgi:plastocyanin